jgi:thiamine transport system ATP-binding protein
MLSVRGIRVAYDGSVALDGVDLEVAEGETAALLGPSGCGKTTFLRVVAGLVEPMAGEVRLGGRDLRGVPTHRRGIGLMFQDYALFPHRDVGGNVAFGLRMRGDTRTAQRARVEEVLELVGLGGFADRSVATLSGGEQQRVALARALAPAPSLLMLDEPLGALDRTLRERLVLELSELFDRLSITVVYVTHDQTEALALADQVVVMDRGRVIQAGPPAEVWDRPASPAVATFLGLTNLFPAATVLPGLAPSSRNGDGMVLVRPEAVHLEAISSSDRDDDGAVAVVEVTVFRGDHHQVWVTLAGGQRLEARTGASAAEAGDRVRITIDPDGVQRL